MKPGTAFRCDVRLLQALFLWIVRLINTSLGKGEETLPFIGVLDIFGERALSLRGPGGTRKIDTLCTVFFHQDRDRGWEVYRYIPHLYIYIYIYIYIY